ncbi:MAG: 2-oxo acid dehydrogenase subunit E2 [Gammaproteobacteria bacterium]|nr:2-oxo acid dehydrogenase subunit E2 [Gammaproteobacteria bacterium]
MTAATAGMESATLVRWLKAEGDSIAEGDIIAEVETDKAIMEMAAPAGGVLGRIDVPGGTDEVTVGSVIGWLLEPDEDASALPSTDQSAAAAEPAPAPEPEAKPQPAAAAPVHSSTTRPFASPLARRIAKEQGIDITHLTGSGPRGRIVRIDVEGAEKQKLQGQSLLEHSGMRKTIARRLTESKQTIPHFYLTLDCDMEALLDLRRTLNARGEKARQPYRLSVNDFLIKAVAIALQEQPAVNVSWQEDGLLQYSDSDISVAVATEGGLITPVIRKADEKTVLTIAGEVADLAKRARTGQLPPSAYQGGGFTISNLGMYGIKEFSAIINPPQAAILAVGAVEQRPVVKAGELAVGQQLTLTLSADHRAIDGAVAAQFLACLRDLLEDPLSLLV